MQGGFSAKACPVCAGQLRLSRSRHVPPWKPFESKVCAREEVMECCLMTGDADYLIRVAVPDVAALERFILEQLSPMKEVEKIHSSFTLKQVRY